MKPPYRLYNLQDGLQILEDYIGEKTLSLFILWDSILWDSIVHRGIKYLYGIV